MRWIWYIILATALHSLRAEDSEENDLLLPPPPINLDSNLRKALLKALQELENEENEKNEKVVHSDRVVEKAQASSVSIFANSDTVSDAPIRTPTSTPRPFVSQKSIFNVYKSEEEKPTVTITEKDEEQILTSASNSFALSNQANLKLSLESKSSSKSASSNLIQSDEKVTPKIEVTTFSPKTSTEESEAKVEDVQFFSAPLVAAFTVHQDELGLPKKVEPIYKTAGNNQQTQRLLQTQQELQQNQKALQQDVLLRQQEFELQQKQKAVEQELLQNQNQLELQQKQKEIQQDLLLRQEKLQLDLQQKQKVLEQDLLRRQQEANLQQKQKALEEEIFRLNENLKKQAELNFQQQQQNLLLQQQQLRLKANSQFVGGFTPSQPVKEQPQFFNNIQNAKGSVSLLPSINIDSRLPLNAQFLPVNEPINFNSQIRRPVAYQPFVFNQQQNPPQQSNRFHRHESGVGNFVNNFNQKPNSFSFLKSIESPVRSELLLRNNENVFRQQFLQPPDQVDHNRIFRSNVETRPQHLSHLLHNSGALRGKASEDLNIITKVLSLNHFGDGQFLGSTRDERRVPVPRGV